jgi:dTDP-4-amino-4,6-dideoxygalactose transaminase
VTNVPLLDLRREYAVVREEVERAWADALAYMHLLKGPNVAAFEAEIASYLEAPGACGVASGTDALVLGLLALGIGPGDEVIVQANAFVAAIEAIRITGAAPIVIDIEPDGIGPDPGQLERAITPRARAVLVVHLHGAPLDLSAVSAVCQARGLWLIEDGSHAHGAKRRGRAVGTFGEVGCFSAGVVKNLNAYGDAGFVVASDTAILTTVRLLQAHGQERKNHHVRYGCNSRLDELQAAVLRVKLRHLEARNRRRRAIAAHYGQRLAGLDLRLPAQRPGDIHVYHQYVVRSAERQRLQQHLARAGVETGIHYPVPLHRQPAFLRHYGESPALPHAERFADEILSLPVFPELSDAEVERVADSVVAFFR